MTELDAAAIYAKRRVQAATERAEQPVSAYGTGRKLPEPEAVYALRRACVVAAISDNGRARG